MTDAERTRMTEALRWALETGDDPAMASADWLARDIAPGVQGAVHLLTDVEMATLPSLRQAKDAFKTMRVVGETSADRRVGARLYAASIAAGIVHHRQLVSRQSDSAVRRALKGLLDDRKMNESLRVLAGTALSMLESDEHMPREAENGHAT